MSTADDLLTDEEPRPARRGRRKVLTVFLVLLGLLLALVIGVVLFLFKLSHDFDSKTPTIERALPEDYEGRPQEDGSYNIMLFGSDSRQGDADEAHVSGQRADTQMLVHVPADGGAAYVISIMRDTWVDIPGHGQAKINAALDYGGVELQVQTIEQLLDIRVDHVAEIDFQGFRDLTDAVGGVTVDVPLSFESNGHTYTQGEQKLNGEEALVFVRERYSFADGDYQRVRNQRAYLRGLLKTVATPQTLANPVRLNSIVQDFSPYISTDEDFSAAEVVKIGTQVGPKGFNNISWMTLPNQGTGWSEDGQSIVILDEGAVQNLSQALNDGTMADYVKTVPTD